MIHLLDLFVKVSLVIDEPSKVLSFVSLDLHQKQIPVTHIRNLNLLLLRILRLQFLLESVRKSSFKVVLVNYGARVYVLNHFLLVNHVSSNLVVVTCQLITIQYLRRLLRIVFKQCKQARIKQQTWVVQFDAV
jgi:hypothetical protein